MIGNMVTMNYLSNIFIAGAGVVSPIFGLPVASAASDLVNPSSHLQQLQQLQAHLLRTSPYLSPQVHTFNFFFKFTFLNSHKI